MNSLAKIALIAATTIGVALNLGGCSNFFFENQFFKFVNHLPTATPYTDKNSLKVGESLISGALGTDPDGVEDLKSYGMIIDYSDERQADEQRVEEFPFEMTCIPQYPGKITITQWVEDKAGKRDTKTLEREVLANTPEPIKDMKMNCLFSGYHKGDPFNYSFDLTSQNPEGKTILIDSTKGGGIKLELYKTGIEAPVSTVLVDQRITLEMAMGGIFECMSKGHMS